VVKVLKTFTFSIVAFCLNVELFEPFLPTFDFRLSIECADLFFWVVDVSGNSVTSDEVWLWGWLSNEFCCSISADSVDNVFCSIPSHVSLKPLFFCASYIICFSALVTQMKGWSWILLSGLTILMIMIMIVCCAICNPQPPLVTDEI